MNKAQLWERKTDQIVSAELLPEMTPEQVVQTGEHWQRFRVQARERLRRERASVPEHDHWNWDEKSHYLKFTAYRCLGIRGSLPARLCRFELHGRSEERRV